jgi:Glycosyl hydrolase family 10
MRRYFLGAHVTSVLVTMLILFFVPFSTSKAQAENHIAWGVTYSPSQAEYLGLDPKKTYRALIHELGVKRIKLHVNWNVTEPKNNQYDFANLDYYVRQAKRNNIELILVIGMKTGRWPECHTPSWMKKIIPKRRDNEILSYVETIVERYKRVPVVKYWQVENEAFYRFGTCPNWYYEFGTSLIQSEIALVKKIDPSRKIIVSEPGELSDWTKAAKLADIVGITMYRNDWGTTKEIFGTSTYAFLTPEFYASKVAYIDAAYKKPVMSIELQSEPWASKPLREASLSEQAQTMNLGFFRESIALASQSGIDTYYFWGAEWWYWMKVKHTQPDIWNEAKVLFEE